MQLVLGTQSGLDLGMSSPPLPLPPARMRLGERGRRVLRRAAWCSAFLMLVALGVLQGARVAIGAAGVSELAEGAGARQPLRLPRKRAKRAQRPASSGALMTRAPSARGPNSRRGAGRPRPANEPVAHRASLARALQLVGPRPLRDVLRHPLRVLRADAREFRAHAER